tara:strand:+ start:923 stop:1501 length:579 start_codon:yes stop_codon:yes gene_type:complete
MNKNYNIFWGFVFVYALGLFLCVTIPTEAYAATEVNTTTNSDSEVKSRGRTVVISPPPSAISPSMGGSSSDICTSGVSGAVQTQILGISSGETVRDENCERLKISKTLYDMGMKVAAVSVLCQDRRVYDAMGMAGTPCPYLGAIGDLAAKGWKANPALIPKLEILETKDEVKDKRNKVTVGTVGLSMLLFLL